MNSNSNIKRYSQHYHIWYNYFVIAIVQETERQNGQGFETSEFESDLIFYVLFAYIINICDINQVRIYIRG